MSHVSVRTQFCQFQLVESLEQRWELFFDQLELTVGYLIGSKKMTLVGLEVADWKTIVLISEKAKCSSRLRQRAETLHKRSGKRIIVINGIPQPGQYNLTVIDPKFPKEIYDGVILQFAQCCSCNRIELVSIASADAPEMIDGWYGTLGHWKIEKFCYNCASDNARSPWITEKLAAAYRWKMERERYAEDSLKGPL